jgi:hypothetical protein
MRASERQCATVEGRRASHESVGCLVLVFTSIVDTVPLALLTAALDATAGSGIRFSEAREHELNGFAERYLCGGHAGRCHRPGRTRAASRGSTAIMLSTRPANVPST